MVDVKMDVDGSSVSSMNACSSEDPVATARASLGPIARCLMTPTGGVRLRDQQPDIFCRYSFPLAFAVLLAVFFARAPAQPLQHPALTEACRGI